MPRSCPCRTCERKEGAKEERIRRSIYMFLVNKFLLGDTVHTLPIARRLFFSEFQEQVELNTMAFPSQPNRCQAQVEGGLKGFRFPAFSFWNFGLTFVFRWLPLFPRFSLVMSFPALFTSCPFLTSASCCIFSCLLWSWFSPYLSFRNEFRNILNVNQRTKQKHSLSYFKLPHYFNTSISCVD